MGLSIRIVDHSGKVLRHVPPMERTVGDPENQTRRTFHTIRERLCVEECKGEYEAQLVGVHGKVQESVPIDTRGYVALTGKYPPGHPKYTP